MYTRLVAVQLTDFCHTDRFPQGTCKVSSADPPLSRYGGADGASQMTHFTKHDGLNIFRLPVAWQYLVNGVLGGTLDEINFAKYDALVQACLETGAHCIIDIHNYARWNGQVIGAPGGPKTSDFSGLWGQLAGKYKDEGSVVMGLMNEPHDSMSFYDTGLGQKLTGALVEKVPGLASWGASVQAAVTAIRKAGATTQMILLPGTCPLSRPLLIQPTKSGSRQRLHWRQHIRLWWLRCRPRRRH